MLTWYNRRFVEGLKDSRIPVAPSAEHDPVNKATPNPSFGRRMARLRITS
jgi:hypothetical protein